MKSRPAVAALVFAVRSRQPQALARHVEALAGARGRAPLAQVEQAIMVAIRRAVHPGSPPAQVLAVARALWQLIDQPEDAAARRSLAAIATRLADHLLAGREPEAGEQAERVSAWSEAHQHSLLEAVRRVLR
jgi:hypothetical protein